MIDKRKSVLNFNHISKNVSNKEIAEIKVIYKYYHKKNWLFKKSHKYYKTMDFSCEIGSRGLVAIGTIAGGITMNPIVLGTITGSNLILSTYTKAKNYKRKTEMCKFAYTTYEKVLVDLR